MPDGLAILLQFFQARPYFMSSSLAPPTNFQSASRRNSLVGGETIRTLVSGVYARLTSPPPINELLLIPTSESVCGGQVLESCSRRLLSNYLLETTFWSCFQQTI